MNRKFWGFAAALLPICFLSAQEPESQSPKDSNRVALRQPSPEALRHMFEVRQRMKEHSIAINDLAGHIQSLDDAHKLVNLVANEFSGELPSKWATRSIRDRIARAELESAADPGALIPEQRLADVWNDFVGKIGAPQETLLNAAEIHYLRDAQYVSVRLWWSRDEQQIWTIPGIFAVGPDGKVANGSRALEAVRLLWLLGSTTEDFSSIHTEVQKGLLLSDRIPHPEKPPAPGTVKGYVSVRTVSYPVHQAALRYIGDHGARAYNRVIEGLLNELFTN